MMIEIHLDAHSGVAPDLLHKQQVKQALRLGLLEVGNQLPTVREFLRTLMDAVAESGLTVLLSSHIIGELEHVCNYLIMLSASHVQIAGDIQELVQGHKRLVGSR